MAFSLSDQVVEVLHDRGGPGRPDWSVGSGFVVAGRRVLTAAHNAGISGELLIRLRGVDEYPATVAALPDGAAALDPDRDLAILEIAESLPVRPYVRYARLDPHPQFMTPNLEGCWSIGFPRFQEKQRAGRDRPVRESARVDGYIPMGEGLVEGRPTLAATRSPRELPAGEIGRSEWQGMSGAVVFAGRLAFGVVTEHHRAAGGRSLTIAPVALIDQRPDARDWWALLGVDDPSALLTIPVALPGALGQPWSFEAFLASRRRHFTGRQWLFDDIETWLANGPGNARLLTGSPGSGKSAVFAEIAAGRCGPVLAHHCCIADTPATLDPVRFVRGLAAMVAANLPDFADRVGASDELAGRLTDVAVAADPASAFEYGLLEPLRSLPPPLEPQILVVDALDEALATPGPLTIPDLLGPRLGRFPSWLRFLATSRPLAEVRAKLGSPLEFRVDEHTAENTDDLRRLVKARLAGGRLRERTPATGRPRDAVVTSVVDAAAGSFLVATMALDAVELGQMSFEDIADLPPGLGAAYGSFLARLYPDPAATFGPARTVLEAIIAAQERLTRRELGAITELYDEIELPPILQRLAAFVPAQEGRYAPFHQSFVEWLSEFDPRTDLPRAGSFAVSVRRGHDRLAAWCLNAAPPAYRIRHLVAHLVGARRHGELAGAVTDWRWLSAVVEGRHDAGTTSFDLVKALRAALDAIPPEHPRRPVVARLAVAMGMDVHFLARHPKLWFQSCWNRGWWVDTPTAAGAFSEGPATEPSGERLSTVVESWRSERPSGPWLRARWPYPDTGLPILTRIADLDRATNVVAFSRDGTTLWSGGETGVRTWDPLSGAPLAGYPTDDDYVTSLVSTSVDEVVAGTGNGSIVALNAANLAPGRAGRSMAGKAVLTAALPDRLVAAATDEGWIGIWDPATGDWVRTATPGGRISALAASPDGRELIVGTQEFQGPSRVRRLRAGRLSEGATSELESVSWIADVGWSGDGRTVAWTEYDGSLVIRSEGSPERRVDMPDGAKAGALTFTDGDQVIVCSADDAFGIARLLVIDAETGRMRTSVPSHRGAVYSFAVDPAGQYLASAGAEEIRVWDVKGLLSGDHRVVRAMMPDIARFLPDGRLLLAADDREVVHVVDLSGSVVEHELPGHVGGVAGLAVSVDGRVACATGEGAVLLWGPDTWTSQVVTRHQDGATAVAFSRDGRRLATGGGDGVVRLFDLASGTRLAALSVGGRVTHIALAPDERHVAVATFGSFRVWSLADREARTPAVAATTYGLAFTADGRQLVYVAPGAVVVAVDAETGAAVPTESVHEAAHLEELGCRDPRWAWRSPRGRGGHLISALEMPLIELATGHEVAWFPLVWAEATPDRTGRTWALLTKKELYVLTLEVS